MRAKALFKAFICGIMLSISSLAFSQTTVGSVYGAVTDTTGGSLPGSTVVITDVHTGAKQTTITNNGGEYTFSTVSPSDYTVTTTHVGFKSQTQTGVNVQANSNVHVPVSLEAGGVQETVQVEAGVTLVDTREAQLGDTIDREKVENLPSIDRNPYNLISTVTGVQAYNGDTNIGSRNGTTFSVNGFPASTPSFYLDGAYNNAFRQNGGNKTPSPDALSQLRIITSNFDAEFGRSPGGVVNVITRSGTSHYHGSLYEYLRNDVFDSKNYYDDNVALLRQHQFGGTFGGPVPFLRQTFFFVDYEHYIHHAVSIVNSTLLTATALERVGDFSQSKTKPNLKYLDIATAANPTGTGVCPGAATSYVICAAALDTVSQNLLKFVPVYNAAAGLSAQQTAVQNALGDQGTIRIDYNRIRHHQISGTFFNSNAGNGDPTAGGNQIVGIPGSLQAYSGMVNTENQLNTILADNWTINDRTVNQLHGFYSQNRYIIANQIPNRLLADLGSTAPEGGSVVSPPKFTIAGYWTEGPSGAGPSDINQFSFGLIDTAILTRGRHSIKLGGSWNSSKYSEDGNGNNGNGTFNFTASNVTGSSLADFILGKAATFNESSNVRHRSRNQDPALYAQDDWQVTRNLNINLGVRWEVFAPYTGDITEGTFTAGAQSKVIPGAPLGFRYVGDAGVPDGIYHTSYMRFVPRVGFAYDVYGNGRTSLRGGYGMFHNSFTEGDFNNLVQAPFALQITTNATPNLVCPYGGSAPTCPAGTPALINPVPFPFNFSPNNRAFASNAAVYSTRQNESSTPYANEYNLSVEQQLNRTTAVRISYVGSTYMKQYIALDINTPQYVPNAPLSTASYNCRRPYQPYLATKTVNTTTGLPTCTFNAFSSINSFQFASINQQTPANNSKYNSLQVNLHGKLGKQLNFSASYVWGKALNYTGPTVDQTDIRKNYGAADIDLRNRFVFSAVYRAPDVHFLGIIGREVLSGWNISDVTILQSGGPFTVTSGIDTNRDGNNNDRVNVSGDPYTHASTREGKIKQYLNPAAFSTPCFNTTACNPYGNEQRNSLYGPGNVNSNVALYKNFAIYRELHFQLRAEAYNAFNNVNLNNPRTNLTVFPTAAQSITGAASPRQFQFAAKLEF